MTIILIVYRLSSIVYRHPTGTVASGPSRSGLPFTPIVFERGYGQPVGALVELVARVPLDPMPGDPVRLHGRVERLPQVRFFTGCLLLVRQPLRSQPAIHSVTPFFRYSESV